MRALASGRRAGTAEADAELELFCQREYPRLVASLHLICGDAQIAEDLAQETLVRVWDRWARVSQLESPGGWAHHVSMNLARSHLRRRGAERRAHDRGAHDGMLVCVPPDEDGLRDALLELELPDRAVVVLRFYLQFSVSETATVLGIPEGTVKSRTSRALEQLRATVAVVPGEGDSGDA